MNLDLVFDTRYNVKAILCTIFIVLMCIICTGVAPVLSGQLISCHILTPIVRHNDEHAVCLVKCTGHSVTK